MSHMDLICLKKPIIIACGSERVKVVGMEAHSYLQPSQMK